MREGYAFKGHGPKLIDSRGSMVYFRGEPKNGIYLLKGEVNMPTVVVSEAESVDKLQLWHRRLAHISERRLQELHKQGLLGDVRLGSLSFCEQCELGKVKRVNFARTKKETSDKLGYVHSDL